jgi:hypothetical protein
MAPDPSGLPTPKPNPADPLKNPSPNSGHSERGSAPRADDVPPSEPENTQPIETTDVDHPFGPHDIVEGR